MSYNDNLDVLVKFDGLTRNAKMEGLLGVREEKEIRRIIQRPTKLQLKNVQGKLDKVDLEGLPNTHKVYKELLEYVKEQLK